MKKIISITLLISVLFSFVGCSSYLKVANGAYSDISLTRDPDGYTVKRLPEVKETGNAFWGIPVNNSNKKQGLIFRFNGINLEQANGFWPTISLIGMSTVGSLFVASVINPGWLDYGEFGTLFLSTAITLPITGAINNGLFSNSAYQTAAFNLNSKLLAENPDVDVFLNPKYEINKQIGLWSQETKIRANVMGATIIVDEDLRRKADSLYSDPRTPKELTSITSDKNSNNVNEPTTKATTIEVKGSEKIHNFEIGDIVTFTERVEVNNMMLDLEIPDGAITKIDGKDIYINFKFNDKSRTAKKNYSDIKLANALQTTEKISQNSTQTIDESDLQVEGKIESKKSTKQIVVPVMLHDFEIGDIVTFTDRVEVNYTKLDLEIPEGEITKINGNDIYIKYTFNHKRKSTKKKYTEIKLVRK